ncbi:hypothetical protein TNIN_204651 [Trichonephila inaurata madagascariensis]|uniref:Uncharacterized protein n=1 Tax=Trichonephila inaurata madagascariensis TaxID=2747483 RepID=A0A8X7CI47_9ARAC|nr:hypothetical protein TNIN_204651 [Trichonephila inaurata madagascariensis]
MLGAYWEFGAFLEFVTEFEQYFLHDARCDDFEINKRSALLKYQSTCNILEIFRCVFFFAFHTRWESIKER